MEHRHEQGSTTPGLIDPVCGMTVSSGSQHQHLVESHTYYFCSAGCRTKFAADPHKYLHPEQSLAEAQDPALAGAEYSCPMHPEVLQLGPGNCPKCGMALEPVMPSLEEQDNPELDDFRRRFWWTLPLTGWCL